MSKYSRYVGLSQDDRDILKESEIRNYDGGVVYKPKMEDQFLRWLILGSDQQTFYATARSLTIANAEVAVSLLKKDPKLYIDMIADVRKRGLSPKRDTAIFSFALVYVLGTAEAKQYATSKIGTVCRTGDDIQHFVNILTGRKIGDRKVDYMRGWGRSVRNAVRAWFEQKGVKNAVYQSIKYRARHQTSMQKLVRLAHPKPANAQFNRLYQWLAEGDLPDDVMLTMEEGDLVQLWGFEAAKRTVNANGPILQLRGDLVNLIKKYRLPWEAVPNQWLKDVEVLGALVPDMPITATVRHLSRFTRTGLFEDYGLRKLVLDKLADPNVVRSENIHPVQFLNAFLTYRRGHGERSSWIPHPDVTQALEAGFYLSFGNVKPTGKNRMIALDVSGSMTGSTGGGWGWPNCAGMPSLAPREAAAALCMVTVRTEPWYYIVAFSRTIQQIDIRPEMTIDQVIGETSSLWSDSTNIAAPMLAAIDNKFPVDLFEVYTDNELNHSMKPSTALTKFQRAVNPNARLASVAMVSYPHTVADPNRLDMMDFVGFSADTPEMLRRFAVGELDLI